MVLLLIKAFAGAKIATVVKVYKAFVRPILEFATWVRDVELLENVQRHVSRIPFGWNHPEYEEKLIHLLLLSNRRQRGDAIHGI